MLNFYNIPPYYFVNPLKKSKYPFGPRIEPPKKGFYGTITKARTEDMSGGIKEYTFALSKEERKSLNTETLFFRAQDSKGIVEIQQVRASGLNFVIVFKRHTESGAKIRGEGVFTPHYNY